MRKLIVFITDNPNLSKYYHWINGPKFETIYERKENVIFGALNNPADHTIILTDTQEQNYKFALDLYGRLKRSTKSQTTLYVSD